MQQNELMNQTRSHYDDYPFIEGGSQRVAWWREYLGDFLPDADIDGSLMVDVGSSVAVPIADRFRSVLDPDRVVAGVFVGDRSRNRRGLPLAIP